MRFLLIEWLLVVMTRTQECKQKYWLIWLQILPLVFSISSTAVFQKSTPHSSFCCTVRLGECVHQLTNGGRGPNFLVIAFVVREWPQKSYNKDIFISVMRRKCKFAQRSCNLTIFSSSFSTSTRDFIRFTEITQFHCNRSRHDVGSFWTNSDLSVEFDKK